MIDPIFKQEGIRRASIRVNDLSKKMPDAKAWAFKWFRSRELFHMIVGSTKIDLNVPKSAAIVSLLSLLNLRKEEDEAAA